MNTLEKQLEKTGVTIPDILLPQGEDLRQWAVIACDQFTQDRDYWGRAAGTASGSPSALQLIFPEAFLGDEDPAGRISAIHQTMRHYLDRGVFAPPRRGFVYLERDTPFNQKRRGLVAAIDLEQYDWSPAARPLIRSTEGTVPERLPPRMDIRRNAPIELPHILLLIDDDADTLLPALGERARASAPVYQGELMLDSGSVSGWLLDTEADWAFCAEGLEALAGRAATRYGTAGNGVPGEQPFLFAVGDGNHSLAAAKGIWEEYKTTVMPGNSGLPRHMPQPPCRYALVEIENLYDPAIRFEPIHRAVFGLDIDYILKLLSALPDFSCRMITGRKELTRLVAEPVNGNRFGIIFRKRYALVETSGSGIATVGLQPLLDRAIEHNGGASVDYIHGEDELFRLTSTAATGPVTGILLPPVQKAGFFETVARSGPLPRKSFSMGEACEKRFYVECRKLC